MSKEYFEGFGDSYTDGEENFHQPVMVEEVLDLLRVRPGGLYVDATLGGGGHSEALLGKGAQVFGIDRDPAAVAYAEKRLAPFGSNFQGVQGNFADLKLLLQENNIRAVEGVLFDLGVSSYQLQQSRRGFSFHDEAPLDMRMDPSSRLTAEEVVNEWPERELFRIFRDYGEERYARRIARAIAIERQRRRIQTARQLADLILASLPPPARRQGIHPATRVFQALRILVNQELDNLQKALPQAIEILKPGGRLCVISYHSLEDRIVKQAFRAAEHPCTCPPDLPLCVCGQKPLGKIITPKPLLPKAEEVARNPRARSARLRCFEKRSSQEGELL